MSTNNTTMDSKQIAADNAKMYNGIVDFYKGMVEKEVDEKEMYTKTLPNFCESIISSTGSSNGIVMDIGCGPGLTFKYLTNSKYSFQLHGVDISTAMVESAGKEFPSVKFHVSDAENVSSLGINEGTVSGIMSYFMIHHLQPSSISNALVQWRKLMMPKGQLLIATWSTSVDKKPDLMEHFKKEGGYGRVVPKEELEKDLKNAGFTLTSSSMELDKEFGMEILIITATAN